MQPVIAQYNNFKKNIFEESEPSEFQKKIGEYFEELSPFQKKKYSLIGLAMFDILFVALSIVIAKDIAKMSISIFSNPPILPYFFEFSLVICLCVLFAACAESIYKITKIAVDIIKRPNI